MIGISHVAVITPDLDRFRAFYEDVLGLRTAVVLRMTEPPGLRHAVLLVSDTTSIHVSEQPGYDPAAHGVGEEIFARGRIDHFGFLVASLSELEAVRDRLVAVGATDGEIATHCPVYSVEFRDPDGLVGQVDAVNPTWDPHQPNGSVVEEEPDPGMHSRLVAAVS